MGYWIRVGDFWVLAGMLVLLTVLLVAVVIYHARFMDRAHIGQLLIDATGSKQAALQEIERIHAETDIIAGRGSRALKLCRCGHTLFQHRADSPAPCWVPFCGCCEYAARDK